MLTFNSSLIILAGVFIYTILMVLFLNNYQKSKEARVILNNYESGTKTFYFEQIILNSLHVDPNSVSIFLWIERILIVVFVVSALILFKGLAFAFLGAVVVTIVMDDLYKKVIYQSGIENIVKINNFINFFVPHINSGNSADQSLLSYIEYSQDEDLIKFYENRDDPELHLEKHTQQIVDIYEIAKYNEEKGISDYTYILNEIAEDYGQKQIYYNKFISSIGEIKPTVWSYYIGVPALIIISFGQTGDFWKSNMGFVLGIVLLILFTIFKVLIYRLQKNTINTIF